MKDGITKEEIIRISKTDPSKCMYCGKCSASCPSYDEMEYPPHRFVHMFNEGDIRPLLNCTGIYKCLSCYACADRCPRGVEPAKLIEAVRVIAERRREGGAVRAEDVAASLEADTPPQAFVTAFRKYTK